MPSNRRIEIVFNTYYSALAEDLSVNNFKTETLLIPVSKTEKSTKYQK